MIGRGGLVGGMGVAALALAAACNAILGNNDKVLEIDAAGAIESGVGEEGGDADDSQPVADSGSEGGSVVDVALDMGQGTVVDATPDVVQSQSCPTPIFMPNGGAVAQGSNVTIGATGLPRGGVIYYTTDSTTPTHASPVYSTGIQINTAETIRAISSASTCADSPVAFANFTVLLPAPGSLTTPAFPAAPASGAPGTYDAVVPAFTLAVDNSTAWVCLTSDGSVPACGATASTCIANATLSAVAGNAAPVASITTTGTTVTAVACAATFTPSSAASGTFTLQMDPPDLNPPGLVGSAPGTAYSIPVAGIAPVNVEQDGAGLAYSFACVIQTGMPACGINACTSGTLINGPFPAALGSTPVDGDVWSLVGCPAPGGAFLPSVVTSVTYSAPAADDASAPPIDGAARCPGALPLPYPVDGNGSTQPRFFPYGYDGDFCTAQQAGTPGTCPGHVVAGAVGQCWSVTVTPRASACTDGGVVKGWAGVRWQYPANNFSTVGGLNICAATTVTFWAKGAIGGETVSFYAGNNAALYQAKLLNQVLSNTWMQFTMPFVAPGPDSNVTQGFQWLANEPAVGSTLSFMIDDIQWQ